MLNHRIEQLPQRLVHEKPNAKASPLDAAISKSATPIELGGVQVTKHVQHPGTTETGSLSAVLDESCAVSPAPVRGLNEQGIELGVTVVSAKNGGEPTDTSKCFDDKHLAGTDLLERKLNGIRVREQRFAVAGIVQRSSSLKLLKPPLFRRECQAHTNPCFRRRLHVLQGLK
jgi:hypothetical protein